MNDAGVLVSAGDAFWHRNVMRGFSEIALENGWTVVRYPAEQNLEWFIQEWHAAAVILTSPPKDPQVLDKPGLISLAMNWIPADPAMPTVCLDDPLAGELAAQHLLAAGVRHFSSLLYSGEQFALARTGKLRDTVVAAGGAFHRTGLFDLDNPTQPVRWELPDLIPSWLKELPKPCGIFCACDVWARTLACYCRAVGVRVPEDVAIVGVDNDPFSCEQTLPHLSSVAIPWQEMGREAATLVKRALQGKKIEGQRVVVRPSGVIARRSSGIVAVSDPEVAAAVEWIRANAHRPIRVRDIIKVVPTYRHRLERRFHAILGRTIMQEVRQAHVEAAKRLLEMTRLPMPEVALRSGFTSASLLSIAFSRETGMTPGEYRRSVAATGAE